MWSAYHSLVNEAIPVTRVGAPPLIAAPAHEWNTLLTVLMNAQTISTQVVGPESSHFSWHGTVLARKEAANGSNRSESHHTSPG